MPSTLKSWLQGEGWYSEALASDTSCRFTSSTSSCSSATTRTWTSSWRCNTFGSFGATGCPGCWAFWRSAVVRRSQIARSPFAGGSTGTCGREDPGWCTGRRNSAHPLPQGWTAIGSWGCFAIGRCTSWWLWRIRCQLCLSPVITRTTSGQESWHSRGTHDGHVVLLRVTSRESSRVFESLHSFVEFVGRLQCTQCTVSKQVDKSWPSGRRMIPSSALAKQRRRGHEKELGFYMFLSVFSSFCQFLLIYSCLQTCIISQLLSECCFFWILWHLWYCSTSKWNCLCRSWNKFLQSHA